MYEDYGCAVRIVVNSGGLRGLRGSHRPARDGGQPPVPMNKGMADDGRGLSVNTGDANKRLETMGTDGFA